MPRAHRQLPPPLRRSRRARRRIAAALLLVFAGGTAGSFVEGAHHHHHAPSTAGWHGDHSHDSEGKEAVHAGCSLCSLAGTLLPLPESPPPHDVASRWTVVATTAATDAPPRRDRGVFAQPRAPPTA